MLIPAECRCGNLRYYRASDLMMVVGAGRDPRRIKFRCDVCKPVITVTVLEVDRDRMPRITVHRPHGDMGEAIVWMPERLK